jgi:hypothetical protein
MPADPGLAKLVAPLVYVVKTVWSRARRLLVERKAGRTPFGRSNDLLNKGLDDILNRLAAGEAGDTSWQGLLARIEHPFVTPTFLKKPALQEWLADARVRTDAKALARARIMGADAHDAKTLSRLQCAYADATGEDERLAAGPIDALIAILVAGYQATIGPELTSLGGMVQTVAEEIQAGFQRADESIQSIDRKLDTLRPN